MENKKKSMETNKSPENIKRRPYVLIKTVNTHDNKPSY